MPTITTTVTSAAASGATTTVTTTEATPDPTPAQAAAPEVPQPAALQPLGEIVATGFTFGEGPRFHNGKLYIADFGGFEPGTHQSDSNGPLGDHGFIWELDLAKTPVTKRRYACFHDCPPSGLGWLPDGRMLAVATTACELRVETAAGSQVFVKHCDISPGKGAADDFLNDMCVDGHGNAYVDVDFNLFNPDHPEGPARDIALVTPSGELKMQTGSQCVLPNGAIITPDGKTYIVAESIGYCISAFDRAPDGTLSNKRQVADCNAALHTRFPGRFDSAAGAMPDGICLDSEGGIWVAVPAVVFPSDPMVGGVVRYNMDGEITHEIGMKEGFDGTCVAVMFGDDSSLYLVCCHGVGGHAPLGRDNAFVAKVEVPFKAAKSDEFPHYHAGYC